MQKCLIICNGAKEPSAFLREEARESTVICVDGGANTARGAGVRADIVAGDFDSVAPAARRAFKDALWLQIDNQDNTDFEKAFDIVKKLKIKRATVVCAAGNRLDFTLSNLYAAFNYLPYVKIVFKSARWSLWPVTKNASFPSTPGARVSIIPLTKCSGVTLSGLKYSLKNVNLNAGATLTLSNVALKETFAVKLKSGRMFVYIEE